MALLGQQGGSRELVPRPRLLDLFCCQGGASTGYVAAGFKVTGVDIAPQPKYPFEFYEKDALDALRSLMSMWGMYTAAGFGGAPFDHDPADFNLHIRHFDAIHASPPCQAYSATQRLRGNDHADLIAQTRELLTATGKPYVIENVMDAGKHLRDPVMLCGAMFPELRTYRHRLFETNWPLTAPLHPQHVAPQVKMGRAPAPGEWVQAVGNFSGVDEAREAMGMPWANRDGLREAIPPAYTEWIGRQLVEQLVPECKRKVA
jgi:DNA (cytosine-5)-methyltransferase 1